MGALREAGARALPPPLRAVYERTWRALTLLCAATDLEHDQFSARGRPLPISQASPNRPDSKIVYFVVRGSEQPLTRFSFDASDYSRAAPRPRAAAPHYSHAALPRPRDLARSATRPRRRSRRRRSRPRRRRSRRRVCGRARRHGRRPVSYRRARCEPRATRPAAFCARAARRRVRRAAPSAAGPRARSRPRRRPLPRRARTRKQRRLSDSAATAGPSCDRRARVALQALQPYESTIPWAQSCFNRRPE